MEKNSARDLMCKLYIETLCENYMNRDFWFTIYGEEKAKRLLVNVRNERKDIERRKAMSDDALLKEECAKRFPKSMIDDVRKCLDSEDLELNDQERNVIESFKRKDFLMALLYTCWINKFPSSDKNMEKAIINKLEVDFSKIIDSVAIEIYSSCMIHNNFFFYDEVAKDIITSYEGWDGERALEINTDFYGQSCKYMSLDEDYFISKIIADLKGVSAGVFHLDENLSIPSGKEYSVIIATPPHWVTENADDMDCFYTKLVSCANKSCGRIILIDEYHVLASDKMYGFRKKMIDHSLLDIYISGRSLGADIYILHAAEQSEYSPLHFVCGHKYSSSYADNILTLHNKLNKSDVVSIDYDFNAASDLVVGGQGKSYSFNELFSIPKTGIEEKGVNGIQRVFQQKNLANDFSDFVVDAQALDLVEIKGNYRVITEDKLIMYVGDRIRCSYIKADIQNPVYVGHQFAVLDLNKEILIPEYVQILCVKNYLEMAFDDSWERDYYRVTDYNFDSFTEQEFYITPEHKIIGKNYRLRIPSKEEQLKSIDDAKFINASAMERERALRTMLAEKAWLNEEHIRKIKHRIGNELLPVKNDIDAFVKLFHNHPEGLTLGTVRGKDEKVSEMLERLSVCIDKVSESLLDLTRTIDKDNLKPVDIVDVLSKYIKKFAGNKDFTIIPEIPTERIFVNGSKNMIESILQNIVSNAVRHGFIDKSRKDYTIKVFVQYDGSGNVVLTVSNNGAPMSALGKDNYFIRGGVAGDTGHSGIGGADIKDSVDCMGGNVVLLCNEQSDWKVSIRISLPITNTEKI